jgi:DNA polymerase I
MRTLFFDIETNALEDFTTLTDLHTVHCLSLYDAMIPKLGTFAGESMHRGITALKEAGRLVGHNVIKFDIPALKKVVDPSFSPPLVKVIDTMVMSRCIFPNLRELDIQKRTELSRPHAQKAMEMAKDQGLNKDQTKKFVEDYVFEKVVRQFNEDFGPGSHSLRSWGLRLNNLTKLTYGEQDGAFDSYNDEMRKYCERDCVVTQLLYDHLLKQEPSIKMLEYEHLFAFIINQQERHGFAFNVKKAEELELKLISERAEVADELESVCEPTKVEMKTASGWRLELDGEVFEAETKGELRDKLREARKVLKRVEDAVRLENKVKYIPFNPGSRPQIVKQLKKLGYELPKEPDATTPKVDEAALRKIDHPIGEKLLKYLLVQKRLGALSEGNNGWLKLQKNGRIYGSVNTNGAVTGRCTHSKPNVAQVPSCSAPYGEECRGLFGAGEGYKLVGCDASGLELRMLAHYLAIYDGGEYARYLLEDDIHTVNQKAAGLETRDQAKTFIYALLYGAGPELMGNIVGGGINEGIHMQRKFMNNMPALRKLKEAIDYKVKNGGILKGLDGRLLPIRSSHAALNMLLQSAGAVCMKVALIQLFHALGKHRWQHGREYAFVANIHDEFQAEVIPEHAEGFGELAVQAIRVAGKELKLSVQLDGEYKVGQSWAETH